MKVMNFPGIHARRILGWLGVYLTAAGLGGTALGQGLESLAGSDPTTGLPMVSIEATTAETSEPAPNIRVKPGIFTVKRTGDLQQALTVYLEYSGTAQAGIDYEPLPRAIEFPPEVSTTNLTVMPREDNLAEGLETVVAQIVWPLNRMPDYLADSLQSTAKIKINDSLQTAPAFIEMLSPVDGAAYTLGTVIPITAKAVDLTGYISLVEFFDGDQLIGTSQLMFFVAPDPGTPIIHQFEWKGATVGEHLLTAQAKDTQGEVVSSMPVRIKVQLAQGPAVVSIVADDAVAQELPPFVSAIDPGIFTVTRTGDVSKELIVFFSVSGTATPGLDYKPLGSSVVFPSGESSVRLAVVPLSDEIREETETVTVTLLPDPRVGPGPLPDAYTVDPVNYEAAVKILDLKRVDTATLEITAPKDGERFPFGTTILISATAVDPQSEIREVEFYDGEQFLGVSRILTKDAIFPGRPRIHTLEWSEAKVGTHVLQTRAKDAAGLPVLSRSVTILVTAQDDRVVLEIRTVDPTASEAIHADGSLDTAVLVIERVAGREDVEVPVQFDIGGTAINGTDYQKLDTQVVLPAFKNVVEIVVKPIPDQAVEGEETVLLKLLPPACSDEANAPPSCYKIGRYGEAKAIIRDSAGPVISSPNVAIVEPRMGAVFTVGDPILVRAEITGPDARTGMLEIYADDQLLGSAPAASLSVRWLEAKEGTHVLTARVMDSQGASSQSPPVKILVRSPGSDAFVQRALPAAYVAGEKFKVLLRVEPPPGGKAYAVEDLPPAGWLVSDISDEGAVDPLNGKVKFGPFTDLAARLLEYQVTPPAGAFGRQEFKGVSALDGQPFPILGDQVIESAGTRHPADISPANNYISITELTAYAAAWKEGATWATGPVPITVAFLTRAGALWKGGEDYVFDPQAGEAPLCWRNVTASNGVQPASGTVQREAPTVFTPGEPAVVRIQVKPEPGVAAYAVEETLPPGWKISNVNEEGAVVSSAGSIRWGPFLNDEPRTLAYSATAPAGVASAGAFMGKAGFDGFTQVIGGSEKAGATDASTTLRVGAAERLPDQRLRLKLQGRANQLCVLETSTDLKQWTAVEATILGDDGTVSIVTTSMDNNPRFYRLRVPMGR